MTDQSTAPRKFTGWHMLGLMVAFFGVIITVNLTMAMFATTSWTGLITKDSYLAGQTHNEQQEQARRQNALGFSGELTLSRSAVEFRFLDSDSKPIVAQSVTVALGRPADETDDHIVQLHYAGAGAYRSEGALAPGQWKAEINATLDDGTPWRRIWRVYLKPGNDGG